MTVPVKTVDKRLEALRKELEAKCQELESQSKELKALTDHSLRIQADFENAKKRWQKEQSELKEMANADLLKQLLEIVDDFERALMAGLAANAVQNPEDQTFRVGIEMIARRIQEFLKSHGIVPMEAVGKPFDPTRHEAVAHEATDSHEESTVLEELRKGYTMNGRVLRPAVVKVAVKPLTKGGVTGSAGLSQPGTSSNAS